MILIKKHYMILLEYMLASLLGIAAFFLIFPGGFYHFSDFGTANSMWGNSLSIGMSLRIYRRIIFRDFFGIYLPTYKTMVPFYIFWTVVFLVCIYGIIRFLFRKNIDGKALRKKYKEFIGSIADAFRGKGFAYIMMIIAILADMVLSSMSINLIDMGWFSNRYLMPVYPLIAFLMKNPNSDRIDLTEMLADNDAVFICDNVGDPVFLTEKCLNIHSAYFTSAKRYHLFDEGDKKKTDNQLYLVVAHCNLEEYESGKGVKFGAIDDSEPEYYASEREILEHFSNIYEGYDIQYCGDTTLWSGEASIYEIAAM